MKIGLTYTDLENKHKHYADWIKGNDNITVVKLSADDKNKDLVDTCDALVLSGGIDIHPKYYQGNASYANAPDEFKLQRDDFEFHVLNRSIKKSIPILGICRGLQLINVFFKGTLVQDLDEKNPAHRGIEEKNKKNRTDNRHNIHLEKDSLLYKIAEVPSGEVNSAHHQSIGKLGDGLEANSFSNDGVIEGIEWKEKTDKPFMLAVQWHPERMKNIGIVDSPLSKNIRDYFIAEISKPGK
jgi:putative glutamine amidotransferase